MKKMSKLHFYSTPNIYLIFSSANFSFTKRRILSLFEIRMISGFMSFNIKLACAILVFTIYSIEI